MDNISSINIDGKVEDRIADELARLALERTTDEQLTTMINNVLHDKFDAEKSIHGELLLMTHINLF